MLDSWIATARQHGASDLHVEAGMPLAIRVRGDLQTLGEPLPGQDVLAAARQVVGKRWSAFIQRRSFDASRVLQGVQCRINVMATARGVGMAVRLLAGFQPTLDGLNLHPDLARLVQPSHGLVVVCGSTGSGKTTTLAALIQVINLGKPRHVVTIENPIEYHLRPRRAFIRQREVGRDTPSFEQALLDALREDPDVLMVGEMRQPRTMQLTLDAAETGHLVLATMHSSTVTESLQRIVSAFPPEVQASVRAQLADCLTAVLAQRLVYRPDAGTRVAECELLVATDAVRKAVRDGQYFKLQSMMETSAADGMWTFDRYGRWLASKRTWRSPEEGKEGDATPGRLVDLPDAAPATPTAPTQATTAVSAALASSAPPATSTGEPQPADGVIVIDEDDTGAIDELLADLARK